MENNVLNSQVIKESIRPMWFYRRIIPAQLVEPIPFLLDNGYYYDIIEIRAKWPQHEAVPVTTSPEIFISIYDSGRGNRRTAVPIPLRLISSPGNQGVLFNAAFMTAAQGPRNQSRLYVIHPLRGNMYIEIEGQNLIPSPPFIDLVVCGSYVKGDIEGKVWK